MQAKILLLLVLTSLAAASVLHAQPYRAPLSKQPPPRVGMASTMEITSPLKAASAPDLDNVSSAQFAGDPNESSPQLVARYERALGLIMKGAWKRAQLVLERSLVEFPESRHLHTLYSDLLFYRSRGTDPVLLKQSAREAVRAMEIGLGFGTVDYALTDRLSRTLAATGDLETLDRLFAEALARDPSAAVYHDYARALSRLDDPRAEETFKKAMDLEGEGNAMSDYGEWLLDRKRDADTLTMLPKNPRLYYLHFLRGVALERGKRFEEARAAYSQVRDYSAFFPLPSRFRIAGSSLQGASGLFFDDAASQTGSKRGLSNISAPITVDQAIQGLSYTIWGEARAESYGGMLAVGWIVRARALRGSAGNPTCPFVTNSGTTLADKYRSVMCQTSQFVGVCSAWCSNVSTTSCSSTTSTNNAAYDVYWGYGPDPVAHYCPSGISQSGNECDGTIKCNGNTDTYRLASPVFNLGIDLSVQTTCSNHSCAPGNNGRVCANGGARDNCFYTQPSCVGTGRINYTGTVNGTGGNSISAAFQTTTSGSFNGHLEGPDTADFDLYLQMGSSSSGPWTDVASSTHTFATEEVNYSGAAGWYRWRVYSYNGSGNFSLCTKHP
jgi:tetratricopeptide (TPR) repeat protein